MTRKEQIKSAYKLCGSKVSFYDGMMTYSTLTGFDIVLSLNGFHAFPDKEAAALSD